MTEAAERIRNFREKVEAEPGNVFYRFSFGQALFDAARYDEALEQLEHCALSRADWMIPRILMGKAFLANQQPEQARAWLEEAMQLAVEQNHDDPQEEIRELLQDIEQG